MFASDIRLCLCSYLSLASLPWEGGWAKETLHLSETRVKMTTDTRIRLYTMFVTANNLRLFAIKMKF